MLRSGVPSSKKPTLHSDLNDQNAIYISFPHLLFMPSISKEQPICGTVT